MDRDQPFGVGAVKSAGGRVIAESESTAVIFGMPRQAVRTGAVDLVLPLDEIAPTIQSGLDEGRGRRGSGVWQLKGRGEP